MNLIKIKNFSKVALSKIPILPYDEFYSQTKLLLSNPSILVFSYFGQAISENFTNAFILLGSLENDDILLFSTKFEKGIDYPALSSDFTKIQKWESEINENFGIQFVHSPWLKPIRNSWNRFDKNQNFTNYPFFNIESESLHHVGVGPVHAGVIEPGHFRFICSGEEILHLEIQLGFQHRGIEHLIIQNQNPYYGLALSEAIAGDSAIAHSTAYLGLVETLENLKPNEYASTVRMILQELERIANHTGDIGNLCIGIAFQPGSAVMGRLRGMPLNLLMLISGDRMGKGCLTFGGINFDLDSEMVSKLENSLTTFETDFNECAELILNNDTVFNRIITLGEISKEKVFECGFQGMAAKMSGVPRDIRKTNPYGWYSEEEMDVKLEQDGDVFSRTSLRIKEVNQSISMIKKGLTQLKDLNYQKVSIAQKNNSSPDYLALAITEGFRGSAVHAAITDHSGKFLHYKITDCSFHNWLALALACRNVGISDFPINNKSFNLSYCGNDL